MSRPPHFIGSSHTQYISGTSGATFSVAVTHAEFDDQPLRGGVLDWLQSGEAREYAGRWVLLDESLRVVDAGSSPGELLDKHSEPAAPIVVFVEPLGKSIAV